MTNQELNEAVARKIGKGHIQDGWEKVCIIPDYAGSIQAAWGLVERQSYVKLLRADNKFRCYMGDLYPPVEARADTATLAICLAFLKLP